MAVQVLQEIVVPLHRVRGPCALQPAGDGIAAFAAAVAVLPAEALLLERGTFRLWTDVLGRGGSAMGFAEGVSADDERHGLLIVHRHAAERLPNHFRRTGRIRFATWPFRIDINQAHVIGAERPLDVPNRIAAVALVSKPGVLRAPKNLVGLPDVGPPKAEAKRPEPHRFHGNVAGVDQEIGPGNPPAVLLLDRPEQPARLVEIRVVGPAVEGSKALRALAATAAAIGDAVRACGMPRHPNEERAVVAVVGGPPVLRGRHHLNEVTL